MLKDNELKLIEGGINITASLISSVIKGVSSILDLGRSLGSTIRRALLGKVCKL